MNKEKALELLQLTGNESVSDQRKVFISLHNKLVQAKMGEKDPKAISIVREKVEQIREAGKVLGLFEGTKKVPTNNVSSEEFIIESGHLFSGKEQDLQNIQTEEPVGVPGTIKRTLLGLTKLEESVAAISLGILTLLMLGDVVAREFFGQSLQMAQKLSLNLMLWTGLLGAVIVANKGGHLRPEIADRVWPAKLKPLLKTFEQAVITVFCFTFAYHSFHFIIESKTMGDVNTVTSIPNWIVQVIFPYTFTSMGIRYFFYTFFPSIRPEDSNEGTEALKAAEEQKHAEGTK